MNINLRDTTFPTRLLSFISSVTPNCQMGYEEKEYLEIVAQQILNHQRDTATDPNEIDYLERTRR